MARAVVHEDSLSPTKDGQLPSASCTSEKLAQSRCLRRPLRLQAEDCQRCRFQTDLPCAEETPPSAA
jgi:hypothetical protein